MGACFGKDDAGITDAPAAATTGNPVTSGGGGELTLTAVRDENYNSKILTFSHTGGVSIDGSTSAIICVAPGLGADGADHMRPYTPLEADDSTLELLVKVYEQGKLSKHLGSLAVGDTIGWKGPKQKLAYEANKWSTIVMLVRICFCILFSTSL